MRGPGQKSFEKPKHVLKTSKRLFAYIGKQWNLLLVVIIMLVLSSGSSLVGSYFLKPLINDYIVPGDFKGLFRGLLVLAVVYSVGVVATFIQTRLTVRITQRIVSTLRHDLFCSLQRLKLEYFDTHAHGELMSRFTNDVDTIQMMLDQGLVQLLSGLLLFVGSLILMFVISPLLFSISLILIVIMIGLSGKIGNTSRIYFMKQMKLTGELNGYIEEAITGLKEITVFGHESQSQQVFDRLNEGYQQTSTRANFSVGMIMPIMNNLNNVSYAVIATVGSILTFQGHFTVGSLVAYLQYSRQIGQPINQITNQLNNVLAALAGAERVFEVMDQQPEVDMGKTELHALDGEWVWKSVKTNGDVQMTPLRGDVRFDKVTFGYELGKPVLEDISLFAKPGQMIAFVGSTGAGKTTITQLINRFYEIHQGMITYDGVAISAITKESLRRSLGMVLQDTHLFNGTVMENIRYGNLLATDEDCIKAAKMVGADSFISRLPHGYMTEINADGVSLSQGQRQLIAIARVCVANPPVMILDEATSSIDTRTERLIERGLKTLMKGRTVFVIAHRLSTVRNADAILVIEHGKIIERGSHEELLAAKGAYYRLCTGATTLD